MEVATRTLKNFFASTGTSYKVPNADVTFLAVEAKTLLSNEKTLLELTSPIVVVGDLHGHLVDLLHLLQNSGLPPDNKYLFLGDFIDRGPRSIETLCLLFALKIRFPKSIFLLRGNHESFEMAQNNEFGEDCKTKLFPSALMIFAEAFDVMPIAAVIDKKIFCVHGGLSRGFMKLSDIAKIRRPLSLPESGPIADLLWSDPSYTVQEWGPSKRGNTFVWGQKVAHKFMEDNGLTMIVRAHQVVYEGYGFPFPSDKSVVTLYSASTSANGAKNIAAYMVITPGAAPKFVQMAQLARNASLAIYWPEGNAKEMHA